MKVVLLLAALLAVPLAAGAAYAQANAQVVSTDKGTLNVDFALEPDAVSAGEPAKMKIGFVNPNTDRIQEHIDYNLVVSAAGGGAPVKSIPLTHTSSGSVSIPVEFESDGPHTVQMEIKGILFQPIPTETASIALTVGGGEGQPGQDAQGREDVSGDDAAAPGDDADAAAPGDDADAAAPGDDADAAAPGDDADAAAPGDDADAAAPGDGQNNKEGGGCLIATAAYGTEMAGQVQLLREVRDGAVMKTPAGASFVESFNAAYYAFSPAVADLERQSPAFREAVRIGIAPMLATLSLLGATEIDSGEEVVAYGLAVILMNAALYAGVPVASVLAARRGLAARAQPGRPQEARPS